jgi:hypothetical protein
MEFEYYKSLPSVALVVEAAVMAHRINKHGTLVIHHHQRHVGREKLRDVYNRCCRDFLPDKSWTFEELYNSVDRRIGGEYGIGRLTVYDVAVRIGSKFEIWPDCVYLQCGSLVGARKCGYTQRRKIEKNELNQELMPLLSLNMGLHPVEVYFCMYC